MKKLLLLALILLLTACSSESEEPAKDDQNSEDKIVVELKTKEEQEEALGALSKSDYESKFKAGWEQAKEWGIEDDRLLHEIALVLIAEETMYNTDLSKEEVIAIAEDNISLIDSVKTYALLQYKISITEEKINDYMKEVHNSMDTNSPQLQGYAAALNLDPVEYIDKYYTIQYENQLLTGALIDRLVAGGISQEEAMLQLKDSLANFRLENSSGPEIEMVLPQ
ncbi:hypothetical protein HNQ94_002551 [Salirhabdus euzebyi]|uniref:SurA N-terminal domain-containing protein n=1 Tax=Salirhabdus euzebyi TaxID=394506 RepID=A0A841Q6Q9_9BACI|nr:hypothetical protein [Salirhabdus euzebyi]MBB6454100.1 hypothetical protein [Salirhabdus euzebyi]